MNRISLIAVTLMGFTSHALMAAVKPMTTAKPTATKPAKAANPSKMTCQEFLEYDEVTRPQIVFWSEGFSKKGKPDDVVFDVERTNQLVPMVVTDCTKEPSASFWSKVKMEFKKVF
jgi:acid stress chaperone HdeA